MKRMISILLTVILVVTLSGCQGASSDKSGNTDKKIECSICGQLNSAENNFCSECGGGLNASNGKSEDIRHGGSGIAEDTTQNHNILSYFKSISDKPLIIYECEIAKDAKVGYAYVIKNGQCRLYFCSSTLGELSKMTDDQIVEMLENKYQGGLEEARSIWTNDDATNEAILNGKVRLYEPRSYDIEGCLFTDDTGNSVLGELLFFPKAGIGGNPYVIEYPQFTDYEDRFMNYYSTREDSDSPWDIKFDIEYFNTGYGNKSDVRQINNTYYISGSSIKSGIVYNSHYCVLDTVDNEWAGRNETLCFRVENSYNFNLYLDTLSSSDVSYIDPSESDILQISRSYYNAYYNSFGEFESETEEVIEYVKVLD